MKNMRAASFITKIFSSAPVLLFVFASVLALFFVSAGAGAAFAETESARVETEAARVETGFARADVNDFYVDSLDTVFVLERDKKRNASLIVQESFVVVFPDYDQNRGFERLIPRMYKGAKLHPRVESVVDENGDSVTFKTYKEGDFLVVRLGDADRFVHGANSYVLTYSLRNTVTEYPEENLQEFYWNINGVGWAQPFERVTATLNLGDGLAETLTGDFACYQGAQGEADDCEITLKDGKILAVSKGILNAHENMTIAVGFVPGTFAPQFILKETAAVKMLHFLMPKLMIFIAVIYFLVTLLVRMFAVPHAPGRGTIITRYTPPQNVGGLLAAQLVSKTDRGFAAFLTNLAVLKKIDIIFNEKASGRKRMSLQVLDADSSGLEPNEKLAFEALFAGTVPGKTVKLDGSDAAFATKIEAFKKSQEAAVLESGLLVEETPPVPAAVTAVNYIFTLLYIVWFGITLFGFNTAGRGEWIAFLVAIVLGFFSLAFLAPKRVRTPEGAVVYEHLLGLKRYMKLAETERIKMLQAPATAERFIVAGAETVEPGTAENDVGADADADIDVVEATDSFVDPGLFRLHIYERLLQYAVIFNLEKMWVRETESAYIDVKRNENDGGLYDDDERRRISSLGVFASVAHRASVNSVKETTAAVAKRKAAASSGGSGGWSSSGGSTGGGYSGGGGGGGGGRGW